MIVGADQAHLILTGRKTQIRLPVEPGRPEPVQPQHDYAIQKKIGGRAAFRVIIVSVHDERLGAISYRDARAEGHADRQAFWRHWAELHQLPTPPAADDATLVWVIQLKPHLDPPRLLSRRPGIAGNEYTHSPRQALNREPEAVSVAQQHQITQDAHDRYQLANAADIAAQEARSLSRRLRQETLEAFNAGVEITPELAEIKEQLELIRRKRLQLAA